MDRSFFGIMLVGAHAKCAVWNPNHAVVIGSVGAIEFLLQYRTHGRSLRGHALSPFRQRHGWGRMRWESINEKDGHAATGPWSRIGPARPRRNCLSNPHLGTADNERIGRGFENQRVTR